MATTSLVPAITTITRSTSRIASTSRDERRKKSRKIRQTRCCLPSSGSEAFPASSSTSLPFFANSDLMRPARKA
ncbi:unnamed protein product [Periconia digitata]|uniref:Uncharacterized protein n=1 Tax=Periconia digitata TaxID=1303443 RepID=A0A9W4XQK5_9PLEO|nr:unnamed protein product [Periconia digitata]